MSASPCRYLSACNKVRQPRPRQKTSCTGKQHNARRHGWCVPPRVVWKKPNTTPVRCRLKVANSGLRARLAALERAEEDAAVTEAELFAAKAQLAKLQRWVQAEKEIEAILSQEAQDLGMAPVQLAAAKRQAAALKRELQALEDQRGNDEELRSRLEVA
eukprot:m.422939 g.422939  ORF g.422939 m.422939 type:complete len:159 (-) comp20206_c0_seq6:64-540(-)